MLLEGEWVLGDGFPLVCSQIATDELSGLFFPLQTRDMAIVVVAGMLDSISTGSVRLAIGFESHAPR